MIKQGEEKGDELTLEFLRKETLHRNYVNWTGKLWRKIEELLLREYPDVAKYIEKIKIREKEDPEKILSYLFGYALSSKRYDLSSIEGSVVRYIEYFAPKEGRHLDDFHIARLSANSPSPLPFHSVHKIKTAKDKKDRILTVLDALSQEDYWEKFKKYVEEHASDFIDFVVSMLVFHKWTYKLFSLLTEDDIKKLSKKRLDLDKRVRFLGTAVIHVIKDASKFHSAKWDKLLNDPDFRRQLVFLALEYALTLPEIAGQGKSIVEVLRDTKRKIQNITKRIYSKKKDEYQIEIGGGKKYRATNNLDRIHFPIPCRVTLHKIEALYIIYQFLRETLDPRNPRAKEKRITFYLFGNLYPELESMMLEIIKQYGPELLQTLGVDVIHHRLVRNFGKHLTDPEIELIARDIKQRLSHIKAKAKPEEKLEDMMKVIEKEIVSPLARDLARVVPESYEFIKEKLRSIFTKEAYNTENYARHLIQSFKNAWSKVQEEYQERLINVFTSLLAEFWAHDRGISIFEFKNKLDLEWSQFRESIVKRASFDTNKVIDAFLKFLISHSEKEIEEILDFGELKRSVELSGDKGKEIYEKIIKKMREVAHKYSENSTPLKNAVKNDIENMRVLLMHWDADPELKTFVKPEDVDILTREFANVVLKVLRLILGVAITGDIQKGKRSPEVYIREFFGGLTRNILKSNIPKDDKILVLNKLRTMQNLILEIINPKRRKKEIKYIIDEMKEVLPSLEVFISSDVVEKIRELFVYGLIARHTYKVDYKIKVNQIYEKVPLSKGVEAKTPTHKDFQKHFEEVIKSMVMDVLDKIEESLKFLRGGEYRAAYQSFERNLQDLKEVKNKVRMLYRRLDPEGREHYSKEVQQLIRRIRTIERNIENFENELSDVVRYIGEEHREFSLRKSKIAEEFPVTGVPNFYIFQDEKFVDKYRDPMKDLYMNIIKRKEIDWGKYPWVKDPPDLTTDDIKEFWDTALRVIVRNEEKTRLLFIDAVARIIQRKGEDSKKTIREIGKLWHILGMGIRFPNEEESRKFTRIFREIRMKKEARKKGLTQYDRFIKHISKLKEMIKSWFEDEL